jgi:acetolactate synthase-1/3 small subunit
MQCNNSSPHAGEDDADTKVLELTVNNHPGVMAHICGLFSRRAYNMGGILCMPINGGQTSRIWIRVDNNRQLDQVVKQLRKLEDVQTVRFHAADHQAFVKLETYFKVK